MWKRLGIVVLALTTLFAGAESVDRRGGKASGADPFPLSLADRGGESGGPQGDRRIEPPRRVTDGEWTGPSRTSRREFFQQGRAADTTENDPFFEGEVGGIYLYVEVEPQDPDRYGSDPCSGATSLLVGSEATGRRDPIDIEPGYLPPGTFENFEPEKLMCDETGRAVRTFRQFTLVPEGASPAIYISRHVGRQVLAYTGASSRRVESGVVDGQEAAFVHPVNEQGYGESLIVLQESFGMTVVQGIHIPFEETLKIARGIR